MSVTSLTVRDIRFPTSLSGDGSDAMHLDPDYSCAYVILRTDKTDLLGHGLTFTIGRGTEVVVQAVKALEPLVVGKKLDDIYNNFGQFWKTLACHSQIRWIGPEKGVIHLATAAIINALWDLWAKIEGKPLWKLLVDMEPEKLVSVMDFRYITDALTKEEALDILKKNRPFKQKREKELLEKGFPAYTTGVGWVGYTEEKRRELCRQALSDGYTRFKAKVGTSIEEDRKRLNIIREEIGWDNLLMVDANQIWDVNQAIDWMKELADFKPLWIEEPTSPDDILGHATISKALKPFGIGVATGEHCQNRVMFKQFLQAEGLQYCQIDSCRLGGVNEILSVILMAAKFGVPVCPHAGGVGLCEYVQHLSMWDFVAVSGSMENRMTEYVPHLNEHYAHPAVCKKGRYIAPQTAGYGCQMKEESLKRYEFPNGTYWSSKH
jgi:L-fuconate dehydratase